MGSDEVAYIEILDPSGYVFASGIAFGTGPVVTNRYVAGKNVPAPDST